MSLITLLPYLTAAAAIVPDVEALIKDLIAVISAHTTAASGSTTTTA